MQVNYVPFVDRMIDKYEGAYGWNKKDPGGPTKYGITCYDLAQHLGQKMDSMARWAPIVQAVTRQTAEQIYLTKYGNAIRFNDLQSGVDCLMMDYGVNSGTSRVLLVARALLGLKGGSAPMDATLLDAINRTDPVHFINAMCTERLSFMHAIRGGSSWKEFGGGWQKRVDDLRAYCLHIITGTHATAPVAVDLSQIETPKVTATGDTAGLGTASVSFGAGTAAYTAGFPWHWIAAAVVAAIVLGIIYEAISAKKASTTNTTVLLPVVPLPPLSRPPAVAPV